MSLTSMFVFRSCRASRDTDIDVHDHASSILLACICAGQTVALQRAIVQRLSLGSFAALTDDIRKFSYDATA